MKIVAGIPPLNKNGNFWTLRVRDGSAVVRSETLTAKFSLSSAEADWIVERAPFLYRESARELSRRISVISGDLLWFGDRVVAELIPTTCGAMTIVARDATTGVPLWEHFVPIPEAAPWAEPSPAWPGADTEEISAFLADDPKHLVVLLTRHSRRSMFYSPTVRVDTMPPRRCQTDAMRFDPVTGKILWQKTYDDVYVGIVEWRAYSGLWSNSTRLGLIDFESGTNTILHELPHTLGWPVRDGTEIAIPWRAKKEVGVQWVDEKGNATRAGAWPEKGVSEIYLHPTEAGLAVQTNSQGLSWLGKETTPRWKVRAKPWVYRVHSAPGTDVFVGTDGNGGRLLAFDPTSGQETLNIKPTSGGAGDLSRIPGQETLVATYHVSKSYSVPPRLLILSMKDHQYSSNEPCSLIGTWEGGAIGVAGRKEQRIAIVDLTAP